jgi:nucleoside-diphosphate-sugar epimerase
MKNPSIILELAKILPGITLIMKKILITGASGFVGSHLVEEALRRGLDVYAGIRKTSSRQYLTDHRIHFVELDFSDKTQLSSTIRQNQFDFIIHNAGVTAAPKDEDFWLVNFEYVKNLTEAIDNIPVRKFLFISSLASYGPASQHDLSDFLKEEDTPNPINVYGKAKLAAERHLTSLPDLPYIIIRPTAVYGPRNEEFVPVFKSLKWHIEGYLGFGRQHLSFVHVSDLSIIVLDAVLSEQERKAYFLSDGKYYSQKEFYAAILKYLKSWTIKITVPIGLIRLIASILEKTIGSSGKFPTLNMEKVKILESRNWKCDVEPLREDFNYSPKYDLEKGMEDTINWFKQQGIL